MLISLLPILLFSKFKAPKLLYAPTSSNLHFPSWLFAVVTVELELLLNHQLIQVILLHWTLFIAIGQRVQDLRDRQ